MPPGAQPGHNWNPLAAHRGCPCQQTRSSQVKKHWDHRAGYSRGLSDFARLDSQSTDNAGENSLETDLDPLWASAMALRLRVGESSGWLWLWKCWLSSLRMRHSQPGSTGSGPPISVLNGVSSGATTSFPLAERPLSQIQASPGHEFDSLPRIYH